MQTKNYVVKRNHKQHTVTDLSKFWDWKGTKNQIFKLY